MDISSVMQMKMANVMQAVNVATLRMSMNAEAQAASSLISGMEAANPAPSGTVLSGHLLHTHV